MRYAICVNLNVKERVWGDRYTNTQYYPPKTTLSSCVEIDTTTKLLYLPSIHPDKILTTMIQCRCGIDDMNGIPFLTYLPPTHTQTSIYPTFHPFQPDIDDDDSRPLWHGPWHWWHEWGPRYFPWFLQIWLDRRWWNNLNHIRFEPFHGHTYGTIWKGRNNNNFREQHTKKGLPTSETAEKHALSV